MSASILVFQFNGHYSGYLGRLGIPSLSKEWHPQASPQLCAELGVEYWVDRV